MKWRKYKLIQNINKNTGANYSSHIKQHILYHSSCIKTHEYAIFLRFLNNTIIKVNYHDC